MTTPGRTLPHELPAGGDPTNFRLSIGRVELSNGASFTPTESGVTAIVGANNVGKSTLLREISGYLSWEHGHHMQQRVLVDQVEISKIGSDADLCAWLYEHSEWVVRAANNYGFLSRSQSILTPSQAIFAWTDPSMADRLGQLTRYILYSGDAHGRMHNVSPMGLDEDGVNTHHPIHRMREDSTLFDKVATYLRDLFQQELTLDWVTNPAQWRLKIGRPTVPAPAIDRLSQEYLGQLRALPGLDQQGDGIKSLLGMLIPLTAATYPVVLIDEPEAFLHPPQARALGKILGSLAREEGLQVILATHDRNIIVGLLESNAPVSVVRLTREHAGSSAYQLEASSLEDVWNDPVLRYSNILEALFHRAIAICEGDRDCRFYAAALEALESLNQEPRSRPPFNVSDILFVPSGGKDGFAKIINAMSAIKAPTMVIADLDVLQDERKLKQLVGIMDGDWSTMENDYKKAVNQINSPRGMVTNGEKLQIISAILNTDPYAKYGAQTERLVKDALRAESPWRRVKEGGINEFRREARVAIERTLDAMDALGVVAVREGELESLAPTVTASKGPRWMTEAFEAKSYAVEPAQAHAMRVLEALETVLSKTEVQMRELEDAD